MDEPTIDKHWHLDKRINVSHFLMTISLIVMFSAWMVRMEKEQAVDRSEINNLKESHQRLNIKIDNQYTEILRRLERIDDRINSVH